MPKLTAQERRHYKARLTAALVASAAVPAEMAPELAAHLLSWDAARIEFDRLIDPTIAPPSPGRICPSACCAR